MKYIETRSQFLGETFIPIHSNHAFIFQKIFKKFPQTLSAYTFASLISWSNYKHEFCLLHDDLLLISREVKGERHLLQPIGNFSFAAQEKIVKELKKLSYPGKIFLVSDEFLVLHKEFCSHFQACLERSRANYLYASKDLAELRGRHYEKKRNLLAQAESFYDWDVVFLDCISEAQKEELFSCILANTKNMSGSKEEIQALGCVLDNFSKLKQQGIVIVIEKSVSAFCVYEELNSATVVVHFEKADKHRKGLYQLINKEAAKAIMKAGYEFINREEDLDIQGLRQAKISYFPVAILSSYVLKLNS